MIRRVLPVATPNSRCRPVPLTPASADRRVSSLWKCAVAEESSGPWNNAGTGHSALCELNYTPARPDGSGGWQFAVIRHGQLAAAANARLVDWVNPKNNDLIAVNQFSIAGPMP